MKRLLKQIFLGFVLLWLLAPWARAGAQEPALNIRLIRNFGFGGVGQIQGTFTVRITNPEGLDRAEFFIDDQLAHTAEGPPFEYRFHTSQFPAGKRTLAAIGYTPGGQALASNTITREFLTAEDARQATGSLLIPILGLVVILFVASALLPALLGRGGNYKPGVYGRAGGAVCPRCQKPYSRHTLAPNLVAGKLERCPHCGKWAIVRRASQAELEAAEARLATAGRPEGGQPEGEEERLRRLIDDSRYED